MITKFENYKYDKFTEEECNELYSSYLSQSRFDEFLEKDELKAMIKECSDIFKHPSKLNSNKTPLIMWAIYKDDLDIIKTLVDNGIDINGKSKPDGDNGLFWAFDNSSYEIIKYIIDHDGDWSNKNNKDQDFLEYMNTWIDRFDTEEEDDDYFINLRERILKEYPEKVKKTIMNRQARKFKI